MRSRCLLTTGILLLALALCPGGAVFAADAPNIVPAGTIAPPPNEALTPPPASSTVAPRGNASVGDVVGLAPRPDDAIDLPDAPEIPVDWRRSHVQTVTLGGNRALTFKGGRPGGRYVLVLTQDAKGSRTVTWPADVRWIARTPPSLTARAGSTDYFDFIFNRKSSTYDGVSVSLGF